VKRVRVFVHPRLLRYLDKIRDAGELVNEVVDMSQ